MSTPKGCLVEISDWIPQHKTPAEEEPRVSEMVGWALNPHARQTAGAKSDVAQWAESVRRLYETDKRAIRVMRLSARHRHARQESETPSQSFYKEAAKWMTETMHSSSMARIISHPSYLRIIGLAREFKKGEIERLILEQLENEPYHWFEALEAITGQNPVSPDDDFDAAVNAWLDWGHREGIVANDNAERAER